MRGEYEILDKLLHKKRLGNGDARVAVDDCQEKRESRLISNRHLS